MLTLLSGTPLFNRGRMLKADPRRVYLERKWRPCNVEKVVYTVPQDVAEERIQFSASKYRNKAGTVLEDQGWEIMEMAGPFLDKGIVARGTIDPDRKQYLIWVACRRRPERVRVDVPDRDVPVYEAAGFKLQG